MRVLETDSNDQVLIGGLLVLNFPRINFAESVKFSQTPQDVGANRFPFVFVFALWYFVNCSPLLRAVCKFRYSLLLRPFFLPVYVSISVTALVEVDFFLGGPDHQPCHPQHLVSSFVFIVLH